MCEDHVFSDLVHMAQVEIRKGSNHCICNGMPPVVGSHVYMCLYMYAHGGTMYGSTS